MSLSKIWLICSYAIAIVYGYFLLLFIEDIWGRLLANNFSDSKDWEAVAFMTLATGLMFFLVRTPIKYVFRKYQKRIDEITPEGFTKTIEIKDNGLKSYVALSADTQKMVVLDIPKEKHKIMDFSNVREWEYSDKPKKGNLFSITIFFNDLDITRIKLCVTEKNAHILMDKFETLMNSDDPRHSNIAPSKPWYGKPATA